VKNDVLPTAVAAKAWPETMMWFGSESFIIKLGFRIQMEF
jgi:hypothetical protein